MSSELTEFGQVSKYYSKQYMSIIGFSYVDQVLSSGFHSKVDLIGVIFIRYDEVCFLNGTIYEVTV